jgi:hypothetical protein
MGPLSAGAAAISTVTPAATTAGLAGEVPKEPKGEPKAEEAAISTVTPAATTAALAGEVPKEPKEEPKAEEAAISTVTPAATTAALAGNVPKEQKEEAKEDLPKATPGSDVPGAFPETPAFETPMTEPAFFSVNPIPATAGAGNPIHLAPGEKVPDPSTITSNTIESTVKEDTEPSAAEPASFSVNPIPATEGAGNPIHLAPGEKVPDPSTITSNTIQSTVKEDPESSATEPASFSVSPIPATAGAGNPIHLAPGEKVPDPSTITSNTIQSTVKTDPESYEKSDAPVTTGEKEAKPAETAGGAFGVPPVTGNMIPESSLPIGKDAEIPDTTDPGVTIQSAAPTSTTAVLAGQVPLEPRGVPEVVEESQEKADAAPEASANPEAVEEKKEVEEELKEKVPEAPAAAESGVSKEGVTGAVVGGAVAAGAAVTGAAVAAKDKLPENVQKTIEPVTNGTTTAPDVPVVVSESIEKAKESPEAAANEQAVKEKSAVEQELEKKVPVENDAGEPAPAAEAAKEEAVVEPAAVPATTEEPKKEEVAPPASGEVSPSTKPVDTTGTEAKATEAKSEPTKTTEAGPVTPKKDTTSAAATPDSAQTDKSKKKKHRVSSFFNKLKEKLK